MPIRQRPIVFLDDYEGRPRFASHIKDGYSPMNDDYRSSDVWESNSKRREIFYSIVSSLLIESQL
jgi:hypothetical protein